MPVALLVFAGFVSLVGLLGPAALLAWGLAGGDGESRNQLRGLLAVALVSATRRSRLPWDDLTQRSDDEGVMATPQAHHLDSRTRCWSLALPIVGDNHSVRVAS